MMTPRTTLLLFATGLQLTACSPSPDDGADASATRDAGQMADAEATLHDARVATEDGGATDGSASPDDGGDAETPLDDGGASPADLVFADDFDYTDPFSAHGWSGGTSANFFHERTGCHSNGCVRILYDQAGTAPYWFGVPIESEHLRDFTVHFYFRVDNTPALGGAKFFKVFGASSDSGYANSTIALDYTSGQLSRISYGTGAVTVNDTQAIIRFDGVATDGEVDTVTATGPFAPPEAEWHELRVYMRYNSDGMRDGEYRVWIDGELRVQAENVKNRHDTNLAYPRSIDLANYASASSRTHDYNLWYDDIAIYRGLVSP